MLHEHEGQKLIWLVSYLLVSQFFVKVLELDHLSLFKISGMFSLLTLQKNVDAALLLWAE